jgi:hypothetical protein
MASCGALALMPENASRLFRIEAMAHVAATLASGTVALPIPTNRLQEFFCEPPLSLAIRESEDPFPNVFVEELSFFDGAYRIFPGPIAGTSFQFQRLCECIFLSENRWPVNIISHAYQVVRAALALSDLMAKRLGLERGTVGDSSERGNVTVPVSSKLLAMGQAVTFSYEEFESYLESAGVDAKQLGGLIVRAGDLGVNDHSLSNGTLLHKPIVRYQDHLVVAAPHRLLAATSQFLLGRLLVPELRNIYADVYPESIMRSADNALTILRHRPIAFAPDVPPNTEGVRERFYVFDSDKILYLLVICDTLEGFDQNAMEAAWGTPHLKRVIIERARHVSAEVFRAVPFANELLALVVPSAVNRTFHLSVDNWPDNMHFLGMAPGNLEIISRVEAGKPLTLFRFNLKSAEAVKKHRIIFFDELDLFAAYRDRNYSYRVGDHQGAMQVLVKPGYGTKLKIKVAHEQDWHPVHFFEANLIVNVVALYGTRAIPLYGMSASSFPCVCVKELPCIVWVYPSQQISESKHSIYLEFVTTVAYWIWQISPFLKETVASQMQSLQMMHVRLSLCASILDTKPGTVQINEPPVLATTAASGIVDIFFENGFAVLLRATDNEAERRILRQLIPCLILASSASIALTSEQVEDVVNRFAPQGLKRMLLHSDLSHVPQLDPRDLPPYRPIQIGEAEDVNDEVGQHVILARDLKPGRIVPKLCNAVLNHMVGFCFSEIAKLVRTLRPDRLMELLLTYNESLIRERSFNHVSTATRMKTFEQSENVVAELAHDMAESAQAGVAARFVIEFVAAQPPIGFRPLSLGVYDRLQALAGNLITLGSISDSHYFKLCDVELSVRPSGRIEVKNAAYSFAQMMQLGDLASSQVSDSDDVFREHMREQLNPVELPPEHAEINQAARAEFGQTLSDLVGFLTALGDIAMGLTPATPAVMERSTLIAALRSELDWDHGKIEQCLDLFSLSARETYLTPPPQSQTADLYPWRFNRSISYLRRPLIVRERNGKSEILWGHRHLDVARCYLVRLCSSTRLKARSHEMKSLLARFRHEAGKRFNDAVFQALQGIPRLVVRKQISKVNDLRTGNVGDIDVLCAELDKHVLWVMECKSLAMARTPYEMTKQLETLTVGDGKHPSIIEKHEARTAWVERHLGEVLKLIHVDPELNWKIQPLVVLDTTPISPLLKRLSMPVISLEMLKRRWPISDTVYVHSDRGTP